MNGRPVSKKKAPADKPLERAAVLPSVFTVRDMNRNTALVLAACRQHGRVIVKHRAGEAFAITPAPNEVQAGSATRPDFVERMRQHRERMRAMGAQGPTTPDGIEQLNKLIAGET